MNSSSVVKFKLTGSDKRRRSGQGCIFKRGDIWWYVFSRNGRRQQRSTGSTERADAERMLSEAISGDTVSFDAETLAIARKLRSLGFDGSLTLRRLKDSKKAKKTNLPRLVRRREHLVGLTSFEDVVAQFLLAKGYTLYRGGWPDFLAITPEGNAVGIECKSTGDELSPSQIIMGRTLKGIGLPVVLVVTDRLNQPHVLEAEEKVEVL
jgi:hypothetical protein